MKGVTILFIIGIIVLIGIIYIIHCMIRIHYYEEFLDRNNKKIRRKF